VYSSSESRVRRDGLLNQGLRTEDLAKLLVGGLEVFRLNSSFSDRGHEVCIAGPSRQNVKMQKMCIRDSFGPAARLEKVVIPNEVRDVQFV